MINNMMFKKSSYSKNWYFYYFKISAKILFSPLPKNWQGLNPININTQVWIFFREREAFFWKTRKILVRFFGVASWTDSWKKLTEIFYRSTIWKSVEIFWKQKIWTDFGIISSIFLFIGSSPGLRLLKNYNDIEGTPPIFSEVI